MYELHFRRWFDTLDDYQLCGKADSLDEISALRKVSGDLVVYAGTTNVVTDPFWLFPWEKKDSESYARKAIKFEIERHKREAKVFV